MKKNHKFPSFIIDDFFETPSIVRNFALNQEFSKNQKGNWPGYRTDPIEKLDLEFYTTFSNKLFTYFTAPFCDFDYVLDTHFQYVDKSFGCGWVHHDNFEKYDFAGVVYLTPNPPENSGTCLYDITEKTDQYTMWDEITMMKLEYMDGECSQSTRDKINPHRDEYNSIFKLQDTCCNKYNRCFIFPASKQHAEQNFFGNDKYDSRLTLCFFGKILVHKDDQKYLFQRKPMTYYGSNI